LLKYFLLLISHSACYPVGEGGVAALTPQKTKEKGIFMKLNIDCVRDILLYCDQEDNAYIEYRSPWSFNGHEYSQHEMVYHVGLCNDADFFHRACLDNVPSCEVEGLSFEGQKYLDTIRSESVFAKVKEEVKKKAVPVTLEVVKGVAVAVISSGITGSV